MTHPLYVCTVCLSSPPLISLSTRHTLKNSDYYSWLCMFGCLALLYFKMINISLKSRAEDDGRIRIASSLTFTLGWLMLLSCLKIPLRLNHITFTSRTGNRSKIPFGFRQCWSKSESQYDTMLTLRTRFWTPICIRNKWQESTLLCYIYLPFLHTHHLRAMKN